MDARLKAEYMSCPLVNGEIIHYPECFDVHCVLEDGAPKWTAREDMFNHEDWKDICLKCPYHYHD